MAGVDILTKTEIFIMPTWWKIAMIVTVVVGGIAIPIAITESLDYCVSVICSILSVACVAMFALLIFGEHRVSTGRYRYQAVISDEVSLNDIYERYEIVKQDGRLWTLEDKKVEE